MFSGLTLVTPPASTPISVADARAHSRISFAIDDAVVAGYISAATRHCENVTNRAFMPQTWQYTLSHWPGRSRGVGYQNSGNYQGFSKWDHFEVPKPPLVSVTSFIYTDTQGNIFNMTQGYGNQAGNYLLDLSPEPARIVLPFAGIWPTTILLPASPIQLTYVCGYPAYSGTVNIDASGIATAQGPLTFDARLAGSWVTVGGFSLNVLAVTDATHAQLLLPTPAPFTLPATNLAFSGNAVPMSIRQAICFLTAHFYENREPVITGRGVVAIEVPSTVDDLLFPYRVGIVGLAA